MEGRRPEGGGAWRPPAPAAEATTGAMTTRHQRQQVKVKHIVTREVSTDQASFKDVVQRLTGKDSAAARAAVVAAGTSSSWSGAAAAAVATAAGVVSQDNVVVEGAIGAGAGAVVSHDNVAWAMLPSEEEDTKRWWRGVR